MWRAKLPMAPAAAPRFPGAGSVPIQCLLDRACGQARQTGEVRDTDSLQAGPPPHRAAPLPASGARGRLTSRPQWTLKAQSAGRRGSIHLQLFTSLRHWKLFQGHFFKWQEVKRKALSEVGKYLITNTKVTLWLNYLAGWTHLLFS